MPDVTFGIERRAFHGHLIGEILTSDEGGVPSNADRKNKTSIDLSQRILSQLQKGSTAQKLVGQTLGNKFESIVLEFIASTFPRLSHLRPGRWIIGKATGGRTALSSYDQYEHLSSLARASQDDRELAAALGHDYSITPDIVIAREPEKDSIINQHELLVDDAVASCTPLRRTNNQLPLLHASVSCKFTLRSDRAQNVRTEALNLIRNRKGHLPHIVSVTAEPLPSRLASLALGTGDIDCVYHFALPELLTAVNEINAPDSAEMLAILVEGKRLRDIADLPLDLAS